MVLIDIISGSVRSNILMGAAYDPVYYKEVVEACGLLQDFTQFIDGDQTLVGDRGVQCSGGQKARYVIKHRNLRRRALIEFYIFLCSLF